MHWWEQLDGPILGRYRIERLLGEGGMARVFLATDVRAERPVAFKTPKIESFPPDSVKELLSRFNREFRSQASDPIQGVIPIYESGEFTDGDGTVRPFLAMQYLSGGSLGDLLGGDIGRRAHRQTLGEVLDWLVPVARTLDRLHARKYLHRDVKPDNIMFNSDGDPFLADLGIVGSLDPTLGGSTIGVTSMGVLGSPGSPGYQSPESIQADASLRNVTASDQFSLAVTVYEALAGALPVKAGTNQEWYGALMHWSPTALSAHCPDLPAAASDAVMKAMSTQPAGRFTTCSEFAKALAASAQAPRVAPAAPPPVPPRAAAPASAASAPASTPSPAARAPASKAWIGGLAVAALLVAGALAWGLGRSPDRSTPGAGVADQHESEVGNEGSDLPPPEKPAAATAWTVRFAFDKVDLDPEDMLILDEAVTFLRRTPEARLLVVGHADPTEGSAAYAMRVSERRASSVVEHLVGNGIEGARLRTEARGGTSPLAPSVRPDGSNDADAIERNRRVEVMLDTAATPEVPAPMTPEPAATEPTVTEAPKPTMSAAQLEAASLRCSDPRDVFDQTESIDNCDKIIDMPGVSAGARTQALIDRARQVLLTEAYAAGEADLELAIKLAPTTALRARALEARGLARIKDGQDSAGEADVARARELTGAPPPGPSWTVCLSSGNSSNGLTLFYTTSEPMDVRNVPGFFERLQRERPDKPTLQAVGAYTGVFFGDCTPIRATAAEARADGARRVAKLLSDRQSARGFTTTRAEGSWRIRGSIGE